MFPEEYYCSLHYHNLISLSGILTSRICPKVSTARKSSTIISFSDTGKPPLSRIVMRRSSFNPDLEDLLLSGSDIREYSGAVCCFHRFLFRIGSRRESRVRLLSSGAIVTPLSLGIWDTFRCPCFKMWLKFLYSDTETIYSYSSYSIIGTFGFLNWRTDNSDAAIGG